MAKNHQIYNASLDEEMLYDLVRSVFDNEETGLFVLNGRLSPHHPVFNPSLYLNRSHRQLEELLVLPVRPSEFQKQLIELLFDLEKPQFALQSSPYQINATLLANRKVPLINFKPVDILSLTKQTYQQEVEKLRELHRLSLKLKEPKAPFDQIRFQSQNRIALLKALSFLQESFDHLYNVSHLAPFSLNKNVLQNKSAGEQMLSLMQKTTFSFRTEQKEEIFEFLRSLQKHRHNSSIEVFLKWLKGELAKSQNARDRLLACQGDLDRMALEMKNLDGGLKQALESYKKENPLLSQAQIIDHWLSTNRPWQKKWLNIDLAKLSAIARAMEQKTAVFLKHERGLLAEFNRDALSFDAQGYLERYQTDYATIFRYFKPAYYRDKKALNAIKANPKFKWGVDETVENLENLILLQKQYNWLASYYGRAKELFGSLDDGLNTDFAQIFHQIDLQKLYRQWVGGYENYQVLVVQNKSMEKTIKQDLAGLYQDEHTDYQQISHLIDWMISYFNTPQSSIAGARELLEQEDVKEETLQKSMGFFGQFDQELEGMKEFVQDKNFIRFKRSISSIPLKELKVQFRNLGGFERALSSFSHQIRSIEPDTTLYNLLRALSFSSRELKKNDIIAAYQKQVLTSWLFAALSRLIQDHLHLEGNEALNKELLKELLTILDIQYYSQRDERAGVKSDREWASLIPALLQSLYPIWILDSVSDYVDLKPGFNMVYFFSPVELTPKTLRENQDYFILDLQKPQRPQRQDRLDRLERAQKADRNTEPAESASVQKTSDQQPEISPEAPAKITQSSQPAPFDSKKDLMKQIVNEQYPIHSDVLANELLPHYGRKRMTGGIRREIQKDIEAHEDLIVKGDYVYPKDYTEIPVRNLKRKLQHISDEEILQALNQADESDTQKRILQAANALGFKTTNTSILRKFGSLLDQSDKSK